MKQSSEKFMDEMLKDNHKDESSIDNDLKNAEKLEEMINKKLDIFYEKFQKDISGMMENKKEEVSTIEENENESNESNEMEGENNNE